MSILAVDILKPRTTGVAVTVSGDLDITGALAVTGDITYDEISGRNLNITGLSTFVGVSTFKEDVWWGGANYDLLWDQTTSKLKWYDNAQACFGDGNDLQIYHNATNSVIKSNTGELGIVGVTTVGILTSYESITIKVGSGSTEVATELKAKASTGKAIAMAMVFG